MADVINKIFDTLDANKDGSINQAELEGIFKIFDEDGNGTVSKAEFQGAYASKLGGTPEHAEKVFGHLDTDGDGEITVTEITQLFKKLDKDGDGSIDKNEFVTGWTAMMA